MSKLFHSCQLRPASRAFTLIEMLVSIAVFAMIATAMLALVDEATLLWRDNEGRIDAGSARGPRPTISEYCCRLESRVHQIQIFSPAAGTGRATYSSWRRCTAQKRARSDVCQSAISGLRPKFRERQPDPRRIGISAIGPLNLIAPRCCGYRRPPPAKASGPCVVRMKITPVSANGRHWASFDPPRTPDFGDDRDHAIDHRPGYGESIGRGGLDGHCSRSEPARADSATRISFPPAAVRQPASAASSLITTLKSLSFSARSWCLHAEHVD
jgi:prepilin-type N-terminal cleavage/methylation domain-containing protein